MHGSHETGSLASSEGAQPAVSGNGDPEAFPLEEASAMVAPALPPTSEERLRQQRSVQYASMLGLKHRLKLTDWNSLPRSGADEALCELFQCQFSRDLPEDPVLGEDGMIYDRSFLATAAERGMKYPSGIAINMRRVIPHDLLTELLQSVKEVLAASRPLTTVQLDYLWAEQAARNGMAALHLIYLLQPENEVSVLDFISRLEDLTSISPAETSRWIHHSFILKVKLDVALSHFYPRISRAFAEADSAAATTELDARSWTREARLSSSFLRLMALISRSAVRPEAPYAFCEVAAVTLAELRFGLLYILRNMNPKLHQDDFGNVLQTFNHSMTADAQYSDFFATNSIFRDLAANLVPRWAEMLADQAYTAMHRDLAIAIVYLGHGKSSRVEYAREHVLSLLALRLQDDASDKHFHPHIAAALGVYAEEHPIDTETGEIILLKLKEFLDSAHLEMWQVNCVTYAVWSLLATNPTLRKGAAHLISNLLDLLVSAENLDCITYTAMALNFIVFSQPDLQLKGGDRAIDAAIRILSYSRLIKCHEHVIQVAANILAHQAGLAEAAEKLLPVIQAVLADANASNQHNTAAYALDWIAYHHPELRERAKETVPNLLDAVKGWADRDCTGVICALRTIVAGDVWIQADLIPTIPYLVDIVGHSENDALADEVAFLINNVLLSGNPRISSEVTSALEGLSAVQAERAKARLDVYGVEPKSPAAATVVRALMAADPCHHPSADEDATAYSA